MSKQEIWTKEEEDFVRESYRKNPSITNRQLADALKRTYTSVKRKVLSLGLRGPGDFKNQYSVTGEVGTTSLPKFLKGGSSMRCPQHKGYAGKAKPKAACRECWYIYFQNNRDRAPKLGVDEQVAHERRLSQCTTELQDLRKKYKELLKEGNLQDKILDFNANAINSLPAVTTPPLVVPKTTKPTVESVVLVGSCWHIGEVINRDAMGGLNEYNFDVFCRRLGFLVDRTIKFTQKNMSAHIFDELHIFLTGDMVSGIIHDELRETNELNIVEQAHLGSLVAAMAIQELARAFPRVIVTCVVGNHGRVTHQKYFKNKQQVNWDYVFYNNLAVLLKNQKNVSFNIPLSFWAGVEVKGHKFLVMHGDLVRSWGGIPFYGLNREVAKWVQIKAAEKDFFHYFVGSHFHTHAELQTPSGQNILNGSLKGGDEYAIGLGLYGDPVQLLFGVHQAYGKTWDLVVKTQYGDDSPNRYLVKRDLPIAKQVHLID